MSTLNVYILDICNLYACNVYFFAAGLVQIWEHSLSLLATPTKDLQLKDPLHRRPEGTKTKTLSQVSAADRKQRRLKKRHQTITGLLSNIG